MKKRVVVAVCALFLCVAATEWAIKGTHGPSGNTGGLGGSIAGVEGVGGGSNAGVYGRSNSGNYGVLGASSAGVIGMNSSITAEGRLGTSDAAVKAFSTCLGCVGVSAQASGSSTRAIDAIGVGSATAVSGNSGSGIALYGITSSGTAVYGYAIPGNPNYAGYFEGRVHVNGTLSKSAGSFRIDHPLDPANKYLQHSFVESPDMKNIYDGVVILGDKGTAVVELPAWFEALNKDFRYQLTTIGEHAPVYIAEEIHDNRFRIAGGYAGMKVSWQVTGSRNDAYAKAYPIPVEEMKAPHEAGRFLHPELFGAPLQQRVNAAQQ